jgi:hypothetical protein
MKRAVIIASERADHQKSFGGAFAEGLRRRGWQAEVSTGEKPCDLLVLWGTRRQDRIARQKAEGGEVVILERGYLGDRFAWTSVSFGGLLNGRGEFRGPCEDGSRFAKHFGRLMAPWNRQDGYALLIGQVPGDMSIRGVDIDAWYRQTATALSKNGWNVRFRAHPLAGRARPPFSGGLPQIGGTLADALQGAGLVVTFNSNTGVEAVLAGRPTIAMDCGSMAWDVAGHQVDEIITPDRTAWASRLAWCQFTRDEMESGYCQEVVEL